MYSSLLKQRLWIVFFCLFTMTYAVDKFKQASDLYMHGEYTQAKKIFEKLAKKNNMQAQYNLGYLYEHGEGVEKNAQQALVWYKKSAKQGYVDAQYNVATFYFTGKGVKKDVQKALYWYEEAGKRGDRNALFNLGTFYAEGKEVEKNKITAFNYWIESAKRSHVKAQESLDLLCKESPWACR